MGCFHEHQLSKLQKRPLQQLWRNHLLAGSLRPADGFDEGFFVFLYPQDNLRCAQAAGEYRSCLSQHDSFAAWTLEAVTAALKRRTSAPWVVAFEDRYLRFGKLLPFGSSLSPLSRCEQ